MKITFSVDKDIFIFFKDKKNKYLHVTIKNNFLFVKISFG